MYKVIYEDNEIMIVKKPAGVESQTSRKFEPDMVSEIKKYLSTKVSTNSSTRVGEPYVGVIHRLDKPVSGIMVYAKTQKAAALLSQQVQNGKIKKVYYAVVCGKLVDNVGNYVDFLLKDGKNNYSRVVDKDMPESRRSELSYRVLGENEAEKVSLVEIVLLTGRHHQIRVQFAAHGNPLWGDGKYNPVWGGTLPTGDNYVGWNERQKEAAAAGISTKSVKSSEPRRECLALSAVRLSFNHPITGKPLEFFEKPDNPAFDLFIIKEQGLN